MKDLNESKHKHLTKDDRQEIQNLLDRGFTFKAIAKVIGKDQTTISKEVKKHMVVHPYSVSMSTGEIKVCSSLLKAPFVCNPCRKRNGYCGFPKRFYKSDAANKDYRALLSEARTGIPLNKQKFYDISEIITKGIEKGQRIYHIIKTNDLDISSSTVYRHINRGYLPVLPIDLPRAVKFKPRKTGHTTTVPRAAKLGRSYDNFLAYIHENDIYHWVEMDTLIGRVGGKVIMTFHFTSCNFMFALLLDNKTASEASSKIRTLKKQLLDLGFPFGSIFPLLLTDNGGEFSNVDVFENNLLDEKESLLFFCNPSHPYEKPNVEKNHTLFRDIVPKGSSFDNFSQDSINLIFSHVNSIKRKVLNGKSTFEIFSFMYGSFLANSLGIYEIPAVQVLQSPKLLKLL